MNPVFDFESAEPPLLSERQLLAELNRRRLRWQTAVLALAGGLGNWSLILTAVLMRSVNELLAVVCAGYAVAGICGGAVVAMVFTDYWRDFGCETLPIR